MSSLEGKTYTVTGLGAKVSDTGEYESLDKEPDKEFTIFFQGYNEDGNFVVEGYCKESEATSGTETFIELAERFGVHTHDTYVANRKTGY